MVRRLPRSTRTDTLFPYTTLFRSKDIDPRALGVHQPNILVVPASSPIKSLDELLAAVKDPKSQYNFPSTGAGTISHLSVELLLERAGGQADRKSTRLHSSH